MLATVGLASGAAWLSIVPTQHLDLWSIWPALAISVLLITGGAYLHLAPDYDRLPLPGRQKALTEGRRHSQAFRDHVADLHDFANRCHDSLFIQVRGNPPVLTVKPINISRPTGHNLRAHFPDVGLQVDAWNSFAERYQRAMDSWREYQLSEANRLFPQGAWDQGVTGLMSTIAKGEVSVTDLQWYVESQRISVADSPSWWGLGRVPVDEASVLDVLSKLWSMVLSVHDLEVAREWREVQAQLTDQQTAVLDALEGAALRRDPPGTCEGCPK